MKLEEYKNSIFIIKDNSKDSILEKINLENKLLNIKLITLSELKKKYYFTYTKKAIYYIVEKYNVIPEIAEIYIENLYYIKDINNEKINFLKKLKLELEENNLLSTNKQFKKFFKNKKIVLYNLSDIDLFYQQIFDELKKESELIEINDEHEYSIKQLYKASNKEEEIVFVANKIVNLIKKGIDINKIKIANLQEDYYFSVRQIFKLFNIPIELPINASIEGTHIIKKFKELYTSDITVTLEKLKEIIKDENDEFIYKKILNIINEYTWIDDYNNVKDMILTDISKINLPYKKIKNAIRIIEFIDEIIKEDEYVILMNFNQGVIPVNSKDEDYLSDKIKKELNISTSIDLNTKKVKTVQRKIATTNNLIVTYSSHNLTSELYISNAYDESLFKEEKIEYDYTNSNAFNKIKLLSAKDENKKFNTVTDELLILNNHYKEEQYCSYDNKFKSVNIDKLNEYLKNKLTLSYSSMNTYYECSFRYYLDNILKVNKFEDSFATVIGNIFHKILSECFVPNYDIDAAWIREIQKSNYEFKLTEKFFLMTLKDELMLVIDTIKKQMETSSLTKVLYEKEIVVPIDKTKNIYFKGFIDKILYDTFDDTTIATVIDYKTGDPDLSLDNLPYGLDMQLPIYIYLLKKAHKNENLRIGGFYLQKILNNIDNKEKRIESLKLQGYTNSSIEIMEKVDSSYNNSQVIKSLKTTSNGFSSYSKILSDEEMNKITDLIAKKIIEASDHILNGEFHINPKQIGDKLVGCKFCKYKDICYLKNADIKKLNKITKNDYLGGEKNAKMD